MEVETTAAFHIVGWVGYQWYCKNPELRMIDWSSESVEALRKRSDIPDSFIGGIIDALWVVSTVSARVSSRSFSARGFCNTTDPRPIQRYERPRGLLLSRRFSRQVRSCVRRLHNSAAHNPERCLGLFGSPAPGGSHPCINASGKSTMELGAISGTRTMKITVSTTSARW